MVLNNCFDFFGRAIHNLHLRSVLNGNLAESPGFQLAESKDVALFGSVGDEQFHCLPS